MTLLTVQTPYGALPEEYPGMNTTDPWWVSCMQCAAVRIRSPPGLSTTLAEQKWEARPPLGVVVKSAPTASVCSEAAGREDAVVPAEELRATPSTVAAATTAVVIRADLSTSARPFPRRFLPESRSPARGFRELTGVGSGGSAGTCSPPVVPWRAPDSCPRPPIAFTLTTK